MKPAQSAATFRKPQEIQSRADVRAFFGELLAAGVNFHPDTSASEYEPPLPKRYDVDISKCFYLAGLQGFDVYEVAVEAMSEWVAAQ